MVFEQSAWQPEEELRVYQFALSEHLFDYYQMPDDHFEDCFVTHKNKLMRLQF